MAPAEMVVAAAWAAHRAVVAPGLETVASEAPVAEAGMEAREVAAQEVREGLLSESSTRAKLRC